MLVTGQQPALPRQLVVSRVNIKLTMLPLSARFWHRQNKHPERTPGTERRNYEHGSHKIYGWQSRYLFGWINSSLHSNPSPFRVLRRWGKCFRLRGGGELSAKKSQLGVTDSRYIYWSYHKGAILSAAVLYFTHASCCWRCTMAHTRDKHARSGWPKGAKGSSSYPSSQNHSGSGSDRGICLWVAMANCCILFHVFDQPVL